MSDGPQCVRCGRPMADQAYADSACAYRAGDQLHAIADMTEAARDVAQGRSRRGASASGSAESRLPLNVGATQRLDDVHKILAAGGVVKIDGTPTRVRGWARHIAETRGIRPPRPETLADDQVAITALWLAGHVEWLRHRAEIAEFMVDVDACARVVAGIARGPSAQRYLGPCGADVPRGETDRLILEHGGDEDIGWAPIFVPCDGDVYCREGAQHGACRTCGAEVSTRERQAWLDGEVRSHAFRATQIAEAYGVNVNTIRTWASRPRPDTGVPPLRSYWRTKAGIVADWTEPPEGETRERLHYVGDVLDLAAADAARRATEQAKRARRAAVREAAEQGDAA